MRDVLLVISAALLMSVGTPTSQPPWLAIQVNVQPSIADPLQLLKRPTPDTYSCSVLVYEAEPKRVVVDTKVVALPGRSETAKQTRGDYTVEFTVKIDPARNINAPADRADTRVTVKRNDAVVAEQRSVITLLHGKARNLPAQ